MTEDRTGPDLERFTSVITEWQRRLLQLDRRNSLLYFSPGKSAVRITGYTPEVLVDRLVNSRRGLTFDYVEPIIRRSRLNRFTVTEPVAVAEASPEPQAVLGDLRADCPSLELQRRLGNLRRRDREWQEEQGLNILFLALGFLQWVDEQDEQVIAPLLLLPAGLKRISPRDPFVLTQDDDDITSNSTLAVELSEFGVELPDFDPEKQTPSGYLNMVREIIGQRSGWAVTEDIFLATFSYSKLAMWRDLEEVKEEGTGNPIVVTLAGEDIASPQGNNSPGIILSGNPEELAGGRLDDLLDMRDQFAVLPADYSQLLAIASAKAGQNLVIHGPPGTGKSQTIANIIATMMAEGKTVLFVSEKTAALDVVKRRLEEKQLGVFCLDLHSERGSKASVYEQLRQSVEDQRATRQLDFDYETLSELRKQLNRAVRALHQVREPLGVTVFQMHGHFAGLRDVPHVDFDVPGAGQLTRERLTILQEVAGRVTRRPMEFQEHNTSRWRVLKSGEPSLELANVVRSDMAALTACIDQLLWRTSETAQELGARVPLTLEQAMQHKALAEHLAKGPGIPALWLQSGVVPRLRRIAKQEAEQQVMRAELVGRLTKAFGEPVPEWNYQSLVRELSLLPAEQELLHRLLGRDFSKRVLQQGLCEAAKGSEQVIRSAMETAIRLAKMLGLDTPGNWAEVQSIVAVARTIGRVAPVPNAWTAPGGTGAVAAILDRAQRIVSQLNETEQRLSSSFDPEVVDAVDQQMLVRYRTDYQNWWRRLFGRYRSDRKILRGLSHAPQRMTFHDELSTVEMALEVVRWRKEWSEISDELSQSLMSRSRGRETDWQAVRRELLDVEALQREWKGKPTTLEQLLSDPDLAAPCRDLADTLGQLSKQIETLLQQVIDPHLNGQFNSGAILIQALLELLHGAIPLLARIESAATQPARRASESIPDLKFLISLLEAGAHLVEIEREHKQTSEALSADFGAKFKGFETNWNEILEAIAWTEKLLSSLEGERVTDRLEGHACHPQAPSFYQERAAAVASAIGSLQAQTESLQERFDLKVGPFGAWERAPFEQVNQWASDLSGNADSASDWLLYRAATEELEKALGVPVLESVRAATHQAELVPQIVERRIIGAWLDWVYQQEPLLARFTSADQESLRDSFKELDSKLPLAAQAAVRTKVFERYPNLYSTPTRAGQLGTLRVELSKKRRQLPVRRLFQRIPDLLQTLKPCFLVSPLAVSQHLPLSSLASETLTFDAVIFDEASQVFPEDAIPATLRGRQLILAGDQKQLPPSHFWRRSMADDDAVDEDEEDEGQSNQLEGRESILDVAVGQIDKLFAERHLNVHYRSRDESLIRFSNHHFYDDRLLTFPSPGRKEAWYGVHDAYLPGARYDAGGSRTNREEAEKVVDLVFTHMRSRPTSESLGVVALSRGQADLIARLVDERRILERGVDQRFSEEVAEPFFVKNLENVQGDERDHIILSIGYGPVVGSGVVPNRFGPINTSGGQRRLNVAITRSRNRMTVVHSLKPTDITSQTEGARLLRRFLEYCANPTLGFGGEATFNPAAETESPFEEAVERALLSRGYRVERQVGVAGYRIDLAILSEDGSHCDLGIECDGWTYHSAPAARDRDWLRQQILEGLGWKIHRVWSTAWVRNPERELAAIERAVVAARAEQPFSSTVDATTPDPEVDDGPEPVESPVNNLSAQSSEVAFEEYVEALLTGIKAGPQLQHEVQENLAPMIAHVAEMEGPVHIDVVIERIRKRYSLGHVRGRTREHVEWAIKRASQNGRVSQEGNFIWSSNVQLSRPPRRPSEGAAPRNIEHISPYELESAVLSVVKAMFGGERQDIVTEAARQFGYQRTGNRVTEALDGTVSRLVKQGKLVESFGMLRAKDS